MMSSKVLLRIAALLITVHLLGHCAGHLGWDSPADPKMQLVVNAMKSYSADFMGANKSMADYYNGYSLMIFGLFGMTISLLWVAPEIMAQSSSLARKILLPTGLAYLYFGIVEFLFFFPFAACVSLSAGVVILVAAWKRK